MYHQNLPPVSSRFIHFAQNFVGAQCYLYDFSSFSVLQEASGTNGSFEFNAFFSACQSRLQCHVLVRLMGVDGGGGKEVTWTNVRFYL